MEKPEIYDPETMKYLNEEFDRLRENCYLDHAGATLYSKTQMKNVFDDLTSTVYGNPHSLGTASKLTLDIIDQIRFRILDHFHTTSDEYSVVFTASATDSLRLLADAFVFSPSGNGGGNFVHLEDNHTSVLGMREVAVEKGARVVSLGHDRAFEIFKTSNKKHGKCLIDSSGNNSLFVYPAQCNFSGIKYPLSWIKKVREYRQLDCTVEDKPGEWFTLLDAAGFVPTNDLNLTNHQADFVCVSFYKIFGYPTGLGALLVKKTAEKCLKKVYYGGGTVKISLSSDMYHSKRSVLHERFEDGTVSFLSIISLRHGFDALSKIPMEKSSLHVFRLAKYLHHSLLELHHANGRPMAILYSDTDYEDETRQGGVVAFNLLRSNGENIGFVEVLNMANLHKIYLRTGCFCNPGACQRHLNLSNEDLKNNFNAGHVCGDETDLINGKPTGAIRASFGYMSTISDVDKLVSMIKKCFLQGPEVLDIPVWWKERRLRLRNKFDGLETEVSHQNFIVGKENEDKNYDEVSGSPENLSGGSFTLRKLFIYPVKSCGSYEVLDSWFIGERGLSYDREWMITTASGVCLTQKQEIKLCLIRPTIRRAENLLELNYPGMPPMKVPLKINPNNGKAAPAVCRSKVCGHRVEGIDCGSDVSEWLSLTLGRPGLRLVRQSRDANIGQAKKTPEISFSSQAQYLMINQASIDWLKEKIPRDSACDRESILDRFRGNIIVEGCQPFEEIKWNNVVIGRTRFKVDGQCTRCQMICIDQNTGKTTVEPLRTLAEEFHGKMRFGIYLSRATSGNELLKIGDRVFSE